jgi:RTX calcium-binding nonapeptide repeat (4 copies)
VIRAPHRRRAAVSVVAALLLGSLAMGFEAMAQTPPPTAPGAVISNDTVMLGVNDTGNLNYDCMANEDPNCPDPSLSGTGHVGLRQVEFNADGTAPGCLCEGWGAADASSGLTGHANEDFGEPVNMNVLEFAATETTAVSTVLISDLEGPHAMTVTHDYHPSPDTPNLYEATVTIANVGAAQLGDVRYRRVMDWDVEPTAFAEWVTIQGAEAADAVLFDSNDGFASANPLAGPSQLGTFDPSICGSETLTGPCDFTDLGSGGGGGERVAGQRFGAAGGGGGDFEEYPQTTTPDDHGALFDFGFGALNPEETVEFRILYGAADDETQAVGALADAQAEVYSLGQPDCSQTGADDVEDVTGCNGLGTFAGVEQGKPVTFIFAFAGVGGDPVEQVCEPPTRVGTPASDKGLFGTSEADKIQGLGGRDHIDGLGASDELCGNERGDFVYGRAGADEVVGNQGNDRLHGNEGDDVISGGPGHDAIISGSGQDEIDAQDELKDCILGNPSQDQISKDPQDLLNPNSGCPAGFWL